MAFTAVISGTVAVVLSIPFLIALTSLGPVGIFFSAAGIGQLIFASVIAKALLCRWIREHAPKPEMVAELVRVTR